MRNQLQPMPHILLIEDDHDLRNTLAEVLGASGHVVHAAEHGQEALELLRGGCHPALILLDMVMPVMDGRRFLELKIADPALATIPVVILSATERQLCPGAVALLAKPIELEVLLEAIAHHHG